MSALDVSDPRVYFAAERTLLAWVRTSLTLMALGFVVARFGLFLELLAASSGGQTMQHPNHWFSSALGIMLVLIGAAIALGAHYNHIRYIASLPAADVPALSITWLAPLLTLSISIVGALLAIYLTIA